MELNRKDAEEKRIPQSLQKVINQATDRQLIPNNSNKTQKIKPTI